MSPELTVTLIIMTLWISTFVVGWRLNSISKSRKSGEEPSVWTKIVALLWIAVMGVSIFWLIGEML